MAIVRTNGPNGISGTTTPLTLNLPWTPTAGRVIVAVVLTGSFTAARSVTSIVQTNVTWTFQTGRTQSSPPAVAHLRVEIWYGVVGAAAGTTITTNLSGNPDVGGGIWVMEYSGLLPVGFLDQVAGNSGYSSNPDSGTTAVTSQPLELWVAVLVHLYVTGTLPTNGFTIQAQGTSGNFRGDFLDKIVSAVGAANTSVTVAGDTWWAGAIATFRGVPGGGGGAIGAGVQGLMLKLMSG